MVGDSHKNQQRSPLDEADQRNRSVLGLVSEIGEN